MRNVWSTCHSNFPKLAAATIRDVHLLARQWTTVEEVLTECVSCPPNCNSPVPTTNRSTVESDFSTRHCRIGMSPWRDFTTKTLWMASDWQLATPRGLEPPTYRLGICRSILLSYGVTPGDQ